MTKSAGLKRILVFPMDLAAHYLRCVEYSNRARTLVKCTVKCARMSITFNKVTECKQCGFQNFRIVGSVYNGDLNYYDLKVKCMRCG